MIISFLLISSPYFPSGLHFSLGLPAGGVWFMLSHVADPQHLPWLLYNVEYTWACINIKTIFPGIGTINIKIRQLWDQCSKLMPVPWSEAGKFWGLTTFSEFPYNFMFMLVLTCCRTSNFFGLGLDTVWDHILSEMTIPILVTEHLDTETLF